VGLGSARTPLSPRGAGRRGGAGHRARQSNGQAGQAASSAGQAGASAGQAASSAGQAGASAGQAASSAGQAASSAGQAGASAGQAASSAGQSEDGPSSSRASQTSPGRDLSEPCWDYPNVCCRQRQAFRLGSDFNFQEEVYHELNQTFPIVS